MTSKEPINVIIPPYEEDTSPQGSTPLTSSFSDTSSETSDSFFDGEFEEFNMESNQPSIDSSVFSMLEKELVQYNDEGKGILSRLKKHGNNLERRRRKIQRRVEKMKRDPNFVRTIDKLAFTIGVVNVILTAVIASRFPSILPIWYSAWAIILIFVRFFEYHNQNFHYFMLDFCYLANLIFIFYLFFYPSSPHLFILNMTNANGPLLLAVVMWRNSLVFHDLDKITSTFIHCLPVIVSFIIRWFPESGEHAVCLNPECKVSFKDIILPHMALFIFWEVCYFLKTEVIDKKLLDADETIITSFRWLKRAEEQSKGEKKSLGYRFVTSFGEKYQILMFMIVQATYHLTSICFVKFMYENMYIHLLVISLVFFVCIWNGGTFYIVKFTVGYQKRMRQLEEEYKKIVQTEKKKIVKEVSE